MQYPLRMKLCENLLKNVFDVRIASFTGFFSTSKIIAFICLYLFVAKGGTTGVSFFLGHAFYSAFGHVLVQIVASLNTHLFPRIVSYGVSISLFTLW